jgi:hypothetical protein
MPLAWRHRRRIIAGCVCLTAIVVFWSLYRWIDDSLGDHRWFTGWTLATCLIALSIFGLRKRLVMLQLLPVSTWTQIHGYTGLFTIALFAMHVPRLIANGPFESMLSLLFWSVSGSGLYGIYISRTAPRKLTAIGQEYRYDTIPWYRAQVASIAQRTILALSQSPDREVLSEYYQRRLAPYLANQPTVFYRLVPSGRRRRQMLLELADLHRYLTPTTITAAGHLAGLVRARDNMDYQHVMQWRLRLWVAIHACLTIGLMAASILHVILVLNFHGGGR